ncbi:MAG: hypothetical protein U0793_25010 [Gemmataceae bacterium]
MGDRHFDKTACELFGSILTPLGFTQRGSERCTFYRKVGEDVFHFVMPSIGSRGAWYQVFVFPHSPHIDPLFEKRFPDNVGIPTDAWSLLSESDGVNITQQQFNCKNEDNLRRGFATTVGPLLLKVAVPYLDRFQKVDDIVPVIRHPSFLGFALHHLGRSEEAVAALQRERARIRTLDMSNKDVAALLEHVERLLKEGEKGTF